MPPIRRLRIQLASVTDLKRRNQLVLLLQAGAAANLLFAAMRNIYRLERGPEQGWAMARALSSLRSKN